MAVPLPASVSVPVQLLQSLIVAATVDAKTGVLTYPAWRARAVATLSTPAGASEWVLLLIDLDHFAELNTSHGHLAVDQVLAGIGTALRSAMGHDACVGRFGGDEFVVLAPVGSRTAAHAIAETARRLVRVLTVTIQGPTGRSRVSGITASVGAAHERRRAARRDPDVALTALLWAADHALYTAKHAGGNTVRCAQPS